MNVRSEKPADRAASVEVERAAFGGPIEAGIVEAVRDEPGSFALVADDSGEVVGHVQASRAWIGDASVLALGPIGVRPDRQGEGIGGALVRASLDEARRRGEAAVILLGSPAYYARLGFEAASRLGLRNPYAGVTDGGFTIEEQDFQIVVLDPAAETGLRGDVRWHDAFG